MTIRILKNLEHSTSHLLPKIARGAISSYDWLSGPAMSEQDHVNRDLVETEPLRHFGNLVV
jgi:hypothetical protein